jgi:hypothetical protein
VNLANLSLAASRVNVVNETHATEREYAILLYLGQLRARKRIQSHLFLKSACGEVTNITG